jgi:SulP family sulfate permease
MRYVPFIDTTGIERLKSFISSSKRMHQKVYLTSIQPNVMEKIMSDIELSELMEKQHVHVCDSTQEALTYLKKINKEQKR